MNNVLKVKGYSLIELLIASSIGLIAIGVVGDVFIKGYSFANQRSLELMVNQDANNALRLIKEDVLRAGSVSGGSTSLKVASAERVIYVGKSQSHAASTLPCIAYAYDGPSSKKVYTTIYLDSSDPANHKLKYRSREPAFSFSDLCTGGQSILYDKLLKVTKFEVNDKVLSSASSTSQLLTIRLEVATLDDAITQAKSIKVKTRNWN